MPICYDPPELAVFPSAVDESLKHLKSIPLSIRHINWLTTNYRRYRTENEKEWGMWITEIEEEEFWLRKEKLELELEENTGNIRKFNSFNDRF